MVDQRQQANEPSNSTGLPPGFGNPQTTTAPNHQITPPARSVLPRRRRWPWIIGVGIVALLIGIGMGAAGSKSGSEIDKEVNAKVADRQHALDLQGAAVQSQAAEAPKIKESAAAQASSIIAAANAQASSASAAASSSLAAAANRQADLDRREAALVPREAEAAKNTFGDGLHLVGQDINPGTYKSSGGAGCYWERLRGTSGEFADIIANDNADGQTVVTIAPSDGAFKSRDCGTWTKVG